MGRLDAESLPGSGDTPVRVFVLPDGEVKAWARRVPGWSLWVVFSFDDEVVRLLGLMERLPPVRRV